MLFGATRFQCRTHFSCHNGTRSRKSQWIKRDNFIRKKLILETENELALVRIVFANSKYISRITVSFLWGRGGGQSSMLSKYEKINSKRKEEWEVLKACGAVFVLCEVIQNKFKNWVSNEMAPASRRTLLLTGLLSKKSFFVPSQIGNYGTKNHVSANACRKN